MAYSGKWWQDGHKRVVNSPPMEFTVPKGYKSPFIGGEMALNELWMGQKKFLRLFHKPIKVSAKDKRGENLLGLQFNPDVPRETPDE